MTTEIQILGARYVKLSLCLSSWHSFDYSQHLLNIRGPSDVYVNSVFDVFFHLYFFQSWASLSQSGAR